MNPGKIWMPGGGGGADLDIITVTDSSDIIAGKTIIDKDGEPLIGTLSGTGTAQDNQVLNGYTYYNTNLKVKSTGNVAIQSILSFSAAVYSSTAIAFTWKNPAKGPFSGVIIVGKTGSYPTSISDGTRYYKGTGNNTTASGTSSITVTSFISGTTYYFRAFSYAVKAGAEWVHTTTYTATAATTKGQQVFTSSGSFTIPANVRSIDIFCVGGGGGGGKGENVPASIPNNEKRYGAGGGAGGYTDTKKSIAVTPGEVLAVTIGAGGAAGIAFYSGDSGGVTSVQRSSTTLGSANGGGGARYYPGGTGGNGGSGGGRGAMVGEDKWDLVTRTATDGGSNGASSSGSGQGVTTRAFGDPSGTLYAGAGGGGGMLKTNEEPRVLINGGTGGSGGGGRGGNYAEAERKGIAGTANTGGGGGGGSGALSTGATGGAGGSGVCIIRWGY